MNVRSIAGRGARFVALAAFLIEVGGCSRLLGIDGDYALPADGDGGGGASTLAWGGATAVAGDGGSPGSGWEDSGTGAAPEPSGRAGSGGTGAGSGGAPGVPPVVASAGGGGGCTSCSPPPVGPCTPGTYEGPQSGEHAPTITVLGFQLDVVGRVTFRLGNSDGGVSAIVDGSVEGKLQILGTPPFSATLTGTVDCETGKLDGTVDGKFWLTSNTGAPPASSFHGTYRGIFSSGKFGGTWSEAEPNAPSTPVGTETGRGKGTWEAGWTGP